MARGVKAEPNPRGVKAEPNPSRGDRQWRTVGARDSDNTVPTQRRGKIPQPRRQRGEEPSPNRNHEERQDAPEQDVAERRVIRRKFNDVKNLINEERDEIYRPGSEKFDSIISEVQALHQQVHKPREQVADAEALLDITNNLLTCVKAQKSEGVTPGDLINSLIKNYGKEDGSDGSAEGSGYNLLWKEIGLAVSHIFKKAPGCQNMLGPMGSEFKQKERKASVRIKYNRSADKARPEELSNKKEEMTDTDKNMLTMFDLLKKNRKVQLDALILNRDSFAQTVENLFALSFLAKDGRAQILVDKEGHHFVLPKNAPAANAVASGDVSYSHFVFRFDFKDWKLMLDSVEEGEELMPHRQPSAMTGSADYRNRGKGPAEPEPDVPNSTPIRKRSRNRGIVIQDRTVVEDSPDANDCDYSESNDAAIRGKRRKLL